MFSDKSERVEENGGAATVVVNNKNEIIDMPGPKKTLNLHKPSVMVSKDTGTFFIQIMNIIDANNDGGVANQLTIRMADTAEGCNPLKGEGAEYTYPWTSKKLDGKLHIWNGKGPNRSMWVKVALGIVGRTNQSV